MDYLRVFIAIATVFVHEGNSLPDWIHDHFQYQTYNGPHVIPFNTFLEESAARHAHLTDHIHHGFIEHPVYHELSHKYITEPVILPKDVTTVTTDHLKDHGQLSHEHKDYHMGHDDIKSYQGPTAFPLVLKSGHIADTPEVAAARSHHLAAVTQARADKYYSGVREYGYGGAYGYSGSYKGYGIPVVLPDGHIADTHEVAMAKTSHLLAVAQAKADKYYSGHEDYNYGGAYGYSGSYHGYGVPVVLPSGHLADTREVAAARTAHMTAVAHAKNHLLDSDHHYYNPHITLQPHLPHYQISYYQPQYHLATLPSVFWAR